MLWDIELNMEKRKKRSREETEEVQKVHVFLGMSTMESYKGKSGNMNEFGNG